MKKVLSILSIVIGGLFLLSAAMPMIIGTILKSQVVSYVSTTDGPTAVFIAGTVGASNTIIEIVFGILFIVAGIFGIRKNLNK